MFAHLAHQDQATLDPLDLDQWEFYVVPTAVLDARERSQHSITLPSLKALHGEPLDVAGISEAVARAAEEGGQGLRPVSRMFVPPDALVGLKNILLNGAALRERAGV